ncbi:OmpA family protein [Candidatus Poribacteria bacterium]|nr:OmpA family protein [Candidatus Poribacteria bacterium]
MIRNVLLSFGLAVLVLPMSGCFLQARALRTENNMLNAHVLQLQQDLEACRGNLTKTQEQLDTESRRLNEENTMLRESFGVLQNTMSETQKNQSQSLLKDVEERLARENEMRLEIDRLSAELEQIVNEKLLLESELKDARRTSAELQTTLSATSERLESAAEVQERLKAERDTISHQLDTAHSDQSEFTLQLNDLNRVLQDRERELEGARRALEVVKAQMAAAPDPEKVRREAIKALTQTLRGSFQGTNAATHVVLLEGDQPIVRIPSDLLFQPGTVLLSDEGLEVLQTLAKGLSSAQFGALRVEGHTDSVPVKSMPFVDNWDLAAARSAAVARWLAAQPDISAKKVSAVSRAFYEPIASNDTIEGRKQNRRVDLVVVP